MRLAPRELRVLLALALLAGAGAVRGEPARPEKVLELPGARELLPPGTSTEARPGSTAPAVVEAAAMRSEAGGKKTLRVALGMLRSAPAARPCSTVAQWIVACQQGRKLVRELAREEPATGILGMTLDGHGPGGRPVAAVHWATGPSPHEGKLEVWLLGGPKPAKAYEGRADGYYFKDVDGSGRMRFVVYESEAGSGVLLPRIYDWSGETLAPTREGEKALAAGLLSDYDQVLREFEAAGPAAEPTAMVADVALLKGRLLERLGEKAEALRSYDLVGRLVRKGKAADPEVAEERRLIEDRAGEAAQRAKTLRGQ